MISAVVLTKNEEKLIDTCLKSLKFANEIIIIDSGSTDNTLKIAEKYKIRIFKKSFTNFSDLRNEGIKQAKYEWIIYLDADEEIPKELKEEILKTINNPKINKIRITGANQIFFRSFRNNQRSLRKSIVLYF